MHFSCFSFILHFFCILRVFFLSFCHFAGCDFRSARERSRLCNLYTDDVTHNPTMKMRFRFDAIGTLCERLRLFLCPLFRSPHTWRRRSLSLSIRAHTHSHSHTRSRSAKLAFSFFSFISVNKAHTCPAVSDFLSHFSHFELQVLWHHASNYNYSHIFAHWTLTLQSDGRTLLSSVSPNHILLLWRSY